jgi:hypothetical protein
MYFQHLKKSHSVQSDEIKTHLQKDQIGRNAQYQFWCGFCKKIIPLRNFGLAAWNERFDHIDGEHFKKGQRIGDWLPAEGHLTNNERDQAQRRKTAMREITGGREATGSDDSYLTDNASSCSSSIGSIEGERSRNNSAISDRDDYYVAGESGRESSVPVIHAQSRAKVGVGLHSQKRKRNLADTASYYGGAAAAASTGKNNSRASRNDYRPRRAVRRARPVNYSDPATEASQETASRLFSIRSAAEPPPIYVYCVCFSLLSFFSW